MPYNRAVDAVAHLPARGLRAVPAHLPALRPDDRPARPVADRGDLRAPGSSAAIVVNADPGLMRGRAIAPRGAQSLAVVVGADQAHEGARPLGRRASGSENSVFPGIKLVHVKNTGVAFGALSGGGAIVLVADGRRARRCSSLLRPPPRRPLLWLPTGLLLGGRCGNLIDRIRVGAVTDFIKLPLWPAFNVADMAITFGVLALLWVLEGPRRPATTLTDGARGPAARGGHAARRVPRRGRSARAPRPQRAIEEGRVRVDGAAVRKSHVARGRRADRGRGRAAARRPPPRRPCPRSRSLIAYEDEHLHRRRQAGRARRAPGPRPPRRARSPRRSPGGSRAARTRPGPASSTGSTRTPPGCSSSRARPAAHRRAEGGARGAHDAARVPGARRGPPARADAARSTRRSGATAAAHPHVLDTDRPREARTHFALERALPRLLAPPRHPRDRPHAPDPRPPRCRSATRWPATPSTARRGGSGSSASSCTPRGSRSRIP